MSIDEDDIGGLVRGPNGPEAGVWVIAETTDLPTTYAKIVVTDDADRYLLPDLPQATNSIRVRGYGLVDSPQVQSAPGRTLDMRAVAAPDVKAATQYYPAIHWYSMLRIPGADQFGGKSDIPEKLTQVDRLKQVKSIGCIGCHQLEQASTRAIPSVVLGGRTHEEAWMRRVQLEQSGEQLTNQFAGVFGGLPLSTMPSGRNGSRGARHRTRSRDVRKGSSATSWSLPGNGTRRSSTCTT